MRRREQAGPVGFEPWASAQVRETRIQSPPEYGSLFLTRCCKGVNRLSKVVMRAISRRRNLRAVNQETGDTSDGEPFKLQPCGLFWWSGLARCRRHRSARHPGLGRAAGSVTLAAGVCPRLANAYQVAPRGCLRWRPHLLGGFPGFSAIDRLKQLKLIAKTMRTRRPQ